ncbi:hypothetical protein PG997_003375 [Apiospora hydei]|uniref:Uncharacterized protein n=1 Tax=Apiospora hydei TaxID=1337664 RepID=A0ABR1WZ65_9PEZI
MDGLALKLQFLNHGGHIVTPSLERRAVTTSAPAKKTCGYYSGDPSRQRTAEAGFDCRVDVSRALWGFCTTTVISAGDCNFAGACFDRDSCLEGCGKLGFTKIPTMTCTSSGFCSTALLDSGRDQTYSHIACGSVATTETLLAAPTAPLVTSTEQPPTSVSTTASPSPSPTPSTSPSTISSGTGAAPTPSSADGRSPASAPSQDSSTSLPPATTAQSGEAGNATPNNTGAIIGGVIGGLAMICLTIFAIVYLFRRGQRRRSEAKTQQQTPGPQEVEYITNSYRENKTPRYPVELHSTPRALSYGPVELYG